MFNNELINLDLFMDKSIRLKTKELFNYEIRIIEAHMLVEEDETFTVYTAFLNIEDKDYAVLIEQEWIVSEALGMYDNKKILRFL